MAVQADATGISVMRNASTAGGPASLRAGSQGCEPSTSLRFLALHLPVHEEPIDGTEARENARRPNRDRLQFAAHERVVLTGFHAQPAKDAAPEPGADERPEGEFPIIHPDDAGGNADKVAN